MSAIAWIFIHKVQPKCPIILAPKVKPKYEAIIMYIVDYIVFLQMLQIIVEYKDELQRVISTKIIGFTLLGLMIQDDGQIKTQSKATGHSHITCGCVCISSIFISGLVCTYSVRPFSSSLHRHLGHH